MAPPPPPRLGSRLVGPILSLTVLLLIVATLVASEALVRRADLDALSDSPVRHPHVYSELYGWALRPGWNGVWSNGKRFTVNRAGYRGREWAVARRSGTTRVLSLGDSIALGAAVADHETFAERLQEMDPGVEVVNLAVSGYGTDQALLRLEREGFRYAPDLVVLNFCLSNDYVDNALDSYLYDAGTPKPYYVVEGGELTLRHAHLKRSWIAWMGLRLREHSDLFNLLTLQVQSPERMGRPATGSSREHWPERYGRVLQRFDAAADLTMRLVERMADLCRARGARFKVVLHPDRGAYFGDETRVAPFRRPLHGLAGAEVLDLRLRYWAAGLTYNLIALDDIGHLTPTGHAFVAEALRDEFLHRDPGNGRGPRSGAPRKGATVEPTPPPEPNPSPTPDLRPLLPRGPVASYLIKLRSVEGRPLVQDPRTGHWIVHPGDLVVFDSDQRNAQGEECAWVEAPEWFVDGIRLPEQTLHPNGLVHRKGSRTPFWLRVRIMNGGTFRASARLDRIDSNVLKIESRPR